MKVSYKVGRTRAQVIFVGDLFIPIYIYINLKKLSETLFLFINNLSSLCLFAKKIKIKTNIKWIGACEISCWMCFVTFLVFESINVTSLSSVFHVNFRFCMIDINYFIRWKKLNWKIEVLRMTVFQISILEYCIVGYWYTLHVTNVVPISIYQITLL